MRGVVSAPVIVPGRPLSTGGYNERYAGALIERSHVEDLLAAAAADRPVVWAVHAGRAAGLREGISVVLRIEPHEVDQVYAHRFGALVREVQGRPAGNATGRGGADPSPTTQLDLLEVSL